MLVLLPLAIAFHSVLSKIHFPFLSVVDFALTAANRIVSIVGTLVMLFADSLAGDLEVPLRLALKGRLYMPRKAGGRFFSSFLGDAPRLA
jgi:hypothetical protein